MGRMDENGNGFRSYDGSHWNAEANPSGLTPAQADAARTAGVSDAAYARQLKQYKAMVATGEYSRQEEPKRTKWDEREDRFRNGK